MNYDELEKVAREIHMRNYSQGKFAKESAEIKEVCQRTGCSKIEAKYHIEKIIHPNGKYFESFSEREAREKKQEQRKEMRENLRKVSDMCGALSGKNQVAKCPKCGSTSITYDGNRISVGRAVVGGALAGGVGAVLGGLTGKKGYAVCLKCGKRWKI